jgi:NADH:ubiquinone oxidoreductase subunit F (NADH-binding)
MNAVALPEEEQTVRLLSGLRPGRALTLDEHVAAYGRPGPARDLLAEIDAARLMGRGGAGFPTAAKLRALTARRGRPVVVVNGVEGEPLSGKDKLLLRALPHLVLDGAAALAGAVGANEVVIAHSAAARAERDALEFALAERVAGGLDARLSIRRVAVPDTYVAGQETALVSFLNGGPALPAFTPPRPFERGIGGQPTLVQNVETAAQVAVLARRGAEWFTRAETALFTVSGGVGRPGVYEARLGTALARLVADAGGLSRAPRAVLVGGYAGTWVDARDARALVLDEGALRRAGSTLGVGVVAVLPEGACGICETARIVRYLAGESAGQCGPCVHGLAALADRLERPGPGDRLLRRWAREVAGRGACRHPDGAARLVLSALDVFGRELEGHDPRRCDGAAR